MLHFKNLIEFTAIAVWTNGPNENCSQLLDRRPARASLQWTKKWDIIFHRSNRFFHTTPLIITNFHLMTASERERDESLISAGHGIVLHYSTAAKGARTWIQLHIFSLLFFYACSSLDPPFTKQWWSRLSVIDFQRLMMIIISWQKSNNSRVCEPRNRGVILIRILSRILTSNQT